MDKNKGSLCKSHYCLAETCSRGQTYVKIINKEVGRKSKATLERQGKNKKTGRKVQGVLEKHFGDVLSLMLIGCINAVTEVRFVFVFT